MQSWWIPEDPKSGWIYLWGFPYFQANSGWRNITSHPGTQWCSFGVIDCLCPMTQSSNNHLLLFRVQGPYKLIFTIHVTTALWDKETSKILNSRLTARCFEDFSCQVLLRHRLNVWPSIGDRRLIILASHGTLNWCTLHTWIQSASLWWLWICMSRKTMIKM